VRVVSQSKKVKGFTLVELMIVVAVIGILASLAAPFLMRAKAAANEASAIGSLRAINTAESNFATTCGSGSYNVNVPSLIAHDYLSPDMGFNPKSGYNFALVAGDGAIAGPVDCNGDATRTGYYSTGRPSAVGQTGNRAFASSGAGTIWQDLTGVPPAEPFTPDANVSTLR
jgi:type IV pilus assembly protein PilA